MTDRMLIAGVGNIFLSDDGFGVEVIRRLHSSALPDWVTVADYGASGMHLAHDLASGYETTILVDAAPRGGTPGTVYVIEPERPDNPPRRRWPGRSAPASSSTRTACSQTSSSACLTCSAPMPGRC